ncbi:MAG: uridine kinase [Candidatus Magasanikbacteria bacterium]|nr:uridine kinase [Candidatus Magasanikbacteria bacterium]
MSKIPLIISAGGTASGKTTLVEAVVKMLGPEKCTVICQDWYYRDHPEKTAEELSQLNYDHPGAFEESLLVDQIKALIQNKIVFTPRYDFRTHRRKPQRVETAPAQVIILEGILALTIKELVDLATFKIFVETDDSIRLLRRMERDMAERGRTFEQVKQQWVETVQPMYLQFCFPSRRFADITVHHGGKNPIVLQMLQKLFGEMATNGLRTMVA